MRSLVIATVGLLFAALVALLLALRSETFVLGAAHWALESFSDLRLELRNPKVEFYQGHFSADEIHLMPQASEGPALLSLLDFLAGFAVPGESDGGSARSFLHTGSVLVYLSDSDEAADPQPAQWLGYLGWLPAELRIGQIHLVTASASTWIFPLHVIRGDRLNNSDYRLTADADYEGEPLGAVVDLLGLGRGWGVNAADISIKLDAPASGSEFTLAGTLEGTKDNFLYDFAANAFYRDISEFLKGFKGGDDLAGELRLQGNMVGDTSGFVLSDATFLLINTPAYAFQASGELEYGFSGKTSIGLTAMGELASLTYLVNWIDLDVADFGRAQSSVKLSGSLDKPVIDEFKLTTSNDAGLAISMSGKLNLFAADISSGPGSNTIFMDVQGPSLSVLQRWLGEFPFEPGPWRASGQLSGYQDTLSLADIVVETGVPGALEMRASGAVGWIKRPQKPEEQYTAGDIVIALQAHAPDSIEFGALLGRDDIPPHQELTASATISGSTNELQLSDGALAVIASDLEATIGPLSAVLRPSDSTPLSGLTGPLLIKLSDTSALSQYTAAYTSQPIPVLGPLQLNATLVQQGALFQLTDIVGSIGEDDLDIRLKGRIGNLAGFSDVALSNTISGLKSRTVLSTLLPDFAYTPALPNVDGSFKLADKGGVWSLSKLALTAGDDKTPLSFSLDGEIANLTGLLTADLSAQFRLGDPALIEELIGMSLAPTGGKLTVASSPTEVRSTLKAQIGQTIIDGDSRVAMEQDSIQAVQLALETPHFYLQDFGFGEAASDEEKPQTDKPEDDTAKEASGDLLASLRRNAPPFPVDLGLKIGGISGQYSSIDSLQIRVTGDDNRYTLNQFSARYNKALAEIRGIIDLNSEPPALSLAGEANALPLSAILKDVGVNSNVSGALTILGGVTVMGDTKEALISNLNGSLAVALENAVIEGAAYDLLATDLLAWIYSGALTEDSTYIDCTMAKFSLRQGVANTDSIFIESPRMIATGKAEFDFVKQRMDLRITPRSKSRMLQVPSEVRLKGAMSDPKADISPITAVADATSAALMLIPNLTMKLFGINRSSNELTRPCQASLVD